MQDFFIWLAASAAIFAWAPPWLVSLVLIAVAVLLALMIHAFAVRLVRRTVSKREAFWQALIARTRRPTRLAIIVAALGPAVSAAPRRPGRRSAARHVLLAVSYTHLTLPTT